jgi:hypothetical protein
VELVAAGEEDGRGPLQLAQGLGVRGVFSARDVHDLHVLDPQRAERLAVIVAGLFRPVGRRRQHDDALLDRTRDFGELHDPKVVRKFVNSIRHLSQDRHGLLPLDAPVRPDENNGQTYADRLASPTLNPEEALLAKEVDQG